MTICLILAHDEAGGIGLKDGLPWERIPEDMKYFRNQTKGRAVIMGRKTFESLDCKPLPGRCNIVLSSHYGKEAETPRCVSETSLTSISLVNDLEKAFLISKDVCKDANYLTYVIGGAEVYKAALPYASMILLTKIPGIHEADTYWSPDLTDWVEASSDPVYNGDELVCTFERHYRFFPDKELPL